MNEYRIELVRDYDSKSLKELISFLKIVFPNGKKFSPEYKKWQYLENPNGKVVSYNAYSAQGELIAHYAAIPVRMYIYGNDVMGLLSLDTATHPAHRGQGLFTKLAEMTFEYARRNGYKFIIGVANANSTYGFLNKLGFYLVSPLDVRIGLGNIFSKYEEKAISVHWSVEAIRWRLNNPYFKYRINREAVYGEIDKTFFKTVVARNDSLKNKVNHLPPFSLYIGLGLEKKGGLYVRLPKFIKRSPFNLIFKDLTNGELPVITKDNIFFQLLDFDVA